MVDTLTLFEMAKRGKNLGAKKAEFGSRPYVKQPGSGDCGSFLAPPFGQEGPVFAPESRPKQPLILSLQAPNVWRSSLGMQSARQLQRLGPSLR